MSSKHKYVLPVIVLSQFAGTSIWFVGNAVLPELRSSLHLSQYAVSMITSAVMLGFVAGTLLYAILSLADRFSPVRLFLVSSIFGALSTSAIVWWAKDANTLFLFRFITGFFLAGIYPVGMKVAADWYEKGLGKALGLLVGALVLGTAFPHLLRNRDFELPWKTVLYCTSLFAVAGGLLMWWLGDGPYRKRSGRFQWNAIPIIFSSIPWRKAATGYFGHMWELYTFWGFVPLMFEYYSSVQHIAMNIPLLSFIVIGSGSLACIGGGYLSARTGSARVAKSALLLSGLCCFLSPLFFQLPPLLFTVFLILWGLAVIPDSPQFSALVAQYAPPELRGTALTIYNSIGFTITIISLFVTDRLFHSNGIISKQYTFTILGLGAVAGLIGMRRAIR